MKRIGIHLALWLVLCGPLAAWGQERPRAEIGLPFIAQHYAPQDYEHHPQNWAVVQDDRGLVYVANNDGVLIFDGVTWRFVPTLTGTFVRSLDVGADGRVYVGARGDIGYLAPDSTGALRYVSLYREVEAQHRNFGDVWGTRATPEGVYFQERHRLFRWDGETMASWESEEGFHTTFVVRDQLYVREIGRGLLEMVDDSLRLVSGGKRFDYTSVFFMVPHGERVLIGTREGFFLHDGAGLTPFPTEADAFVQGGQLYHGAALPGGYVALATRGAGVIVIDSDGEVVQVLDQAAGLPDGVVNYVHAGRQGVLWMALNSGGIARAALPSMLSVYDERLGLKGIVYGIVRHRGMLYVATGSGLYYLEHAPLSADARAQQERARFVPVSGVPPSWNLVSTNQGLLAASDAGVYAVQNGSATQIFDNQAFVLFASNRFEGIVYVGMPDGLGLLRRGEAGWGLRRVSGIDEEIRTMREAEDGTLWLGALSGEVLRVRFPEGPGALPRVERFGTDDGLPGLYPLVTLVDDHLVVATTEGIYHWQPEDEHFVQDLTLLPPEVPAPDSLLSFVEDERGTLWMTFTDRVVTAHRQADGSYTYETPPALHFPRGDVSRTYVEDSGIVWFGNGRELVRYAPALRVPFEEGPFPPLVRRIETVDGRTVFGGARPEEGLARSVTSLDYDRRHLIFSFAAPDYRTTEPTEYQFYLEGVEEEWSAWTTDTEKVYALLWEDDYRFHVRARNGRGAVSAATTFGFRVLPPWYRTWWAYGFYFVLLMAAVAAGRRYQHLLAESRRAQRQERELEEARLAHERLEEANRRLEEANALKDNFLANTSHELRTPLTAILGFTSVLKEEVNGQKQEFLEIIEENSQRLLHTLNALLDIAKLRAGVEVPRIEPVDLGREAQQMMRLLQPLAARKGLELRLEQPDEPVRARLNTDYFERILQNLIGNAIKFTEGGRVTVEVARRGEEAVLHVHDTGIGISEDFLPHLFEEFKQESTGMSRLHEGSGLGMAITARLVELLDGAIDVESVKGEGSTFTVRFPAHVPAPQEEGVAVA